MPLPLTLLLVAACGTAAYDKPGLSYAEWKRDDSECRRAAQGSADRATPDGNAYARCMRDRGYRLPAE